MLPLAQAVGVATACRQLGVPRSHYYRHTARPVAQTPPPATAERRRRRSPRALSAAEEATIMAVLDSERFVDMAPREVYATLLDEGTYHCSWSTMYRLLRQRGQAQRRRDHPRRSAYAKPELVATRPNQLWSWDITKLKGPVTWTYFYLYVIIDVYSRYVVGWLLAGRECAELAEQLIAETTAKEGIAPEQLTLHADRGAPMTAKSVAELLIDLGVAKSHSRPSVSDDNPFSESNFKTLKAHPDYPERFGCEADARAWAQRFFGWYNQEHHHTGLGLMTPAVVHRGEAPVIRAARQQVLGAAYTAHPERFVRGAPAAPGLPAAVWINPPVGRMADPPQQPFSAAAQQDPVMPEGQAGSRGNSAAALDAACPSGHAGPDETLQASEYRDIEKDLSKRY